MDILTTPNFNSKHIKCIEIIIVITYNTVVIIYLYLKQKWMIPKIKSERDSNALLYNRSLKKSL